MTKKSLWVQTILFLAFIGAFFLLNLLMPDTAFSEQENRYLQQLPRFDLSDFLSGRFMTEYENYTTDQFVGRDGWIALKARAELAAGKKENNGVFLCGGDNGKNLLLQSFEKPDDATLDANMAALNTLVQNAGVPVYFALIPDKSQLYAGRLPENTPNDSEAAVIGACYAQSDAVTVDMLTALSAHTDEYIFYRTDHHWTSLGAYYGYTAVAQAMGLDFKPLSTYTRQTVSDAFYGTMWSSSGFTWVGPDSVETFVQPTEGLRVTNYPEGEPVEGSLYAPDFLQKKDKYAYFLGGNTPLQEIVTGTENAPSLLIVRDSYTDSLVPFLLDDFSEIDVLDLRYYRAGLADYIAQKNADMILVCYGVENFSTDSNIFLLGS